MSSTARLPKRDRMCARNRYRFAVLVRDAYTSKPPLVEIAALDAAKVNRLLRQRTLAAGHLWKAAQRIIESRLRHELHSLDQRIDQVSKQLSEQGPGAEKPGAEKPAPPPQIKDLISDLAALEDDFAAVKVNRKQKTILVTTEPIELDGVYLGRFKICLELRYLRQASPYSVFAEDPNPASVCSATTHPHVQDERLCEGEGQRAIRRALDDGRLFDFFVIVRQILGTYNSDSAYIAISDWEGVNCQSCGDTVESGESDGCGDCESHVCRQCRCFCSDCDELFCSDCLSACQGCEGEFCGACLGVCDRCHENFCKPCLKEGQCDACIENEAEKNENQAAAPPAAAVHPHSLGQAEIPA